MPNSLLDIYNEVNSPAQNDELETITPHKNNTKPVESKPSTGFLGTAWDVVKGVVSSPFKELENVVQTGVDAANYVDDKFLGDRFISNDIDIDLAYDPKTGAGKVAQTLGAFATGYAACTKFITGPMQGAKVIQGMKPVFQKGVQNLVAGGVTDFVTGDTTDQRLADVLIEHPKLANPVLSWLASNPDDTALEARAKNAVEGFITGAALDGVMKMFKGIGKAAKASKSGAVDTANALRESLADEITEKAAKETVGNGVSEATSKTVESIDGLTMTREAAAQAQRKAMNQEMGLGYKAVTETGEDVLGSVHAFNYSKFDDATNEAIFAFDKPITQAVDMSTMKMTDIADDAVKSISDLTGDIFIGMDDLKKAVENTAGLSKEISYHTALIQTAIAPRLRRALQLVDDGAAGAIENLGALCGRSLEELVNVKKLLRNVGQGLRSADVLRYIKTEDADTLIKQAMDNPLAYAQETIKNMSPDELVSFARKVTTAQEIGGNVMQVMIDSLPTGNALKKAGTRQSPFLSRLKKYWYASMLSSPKTHIRNLSGNSVKLAAMPLEHTVYGMVKGAGEGYADNGLAGAAIGAIKGASEGYYFLQGLKRSISTAWDMSKIAFSNGTSILRGGNAKYVDNLEPNSIFGYLSGYDVLKKTGGLADNTASKILSLLSGADEFFAQMVYGAEVHSKLMVSLNKSGVLATLKDKAAQKEFIEKYLRDNYDKMYREVMLANGTVVKGGAVYKEALEMANDATFQNELGDWGKGFTSFVSKCKPMQFIFPFQKTPINLFKDAFWVRSPWGAVADIGRAINGKDYEKAYRAFGHLATATLLWGTFYNMVTDGKITGAGPKDPVKRTALREGGWQPYSLKTENGYLNLSSFEPFGSGAMLLADIAEVCQRADVDAGDDSIVNMSEATLNCLLRFAMNRTYLQGLSDLIGSANRDNVGAGYISGLITSFIPNAFKDTAQAFDPTIYETRTVVDQIKARLGMIDELYPRVSWLTGLPMEYAHGGGLGAFNPFILSEDDGTSVTVEMSKMEGIADPQKKINGIELSPQEYSEYCKLHGTLEIDGKTLYQALAETIRSTRYDASRVRMSDPNDLKLSEERNELLVSCINKYRKRVKSVFLREHPELYRRIQRDKAGYEEGAEDKYSALINF